MIDAGQTETNKIDVQENIKSKDYFKVDDNDSGKESTVEME